jgi:hypothetical protein
VILLCLSLFIRAYEWRTGLQKSPEYLQLGKRPKYGNTVAIEENHMNSWISRGFLHTRMAIGSAWRLWNSSVSPIQR